MRERKHGQRSGDDAEQESDRCGPVDSGSAVRELALGIASSGDHPCRVRCCRTATAKVSTAHRRQGFAGANKVAPLMLMPNYDGEIGGPGDHGAPAKASGPTSTTFWLRDMGTIPRGSGLSGRARVLDGTGFCDQNGPKIGADRPGPRLYFYFFDQLRTLAAAVNETSAHR